MALVDTQSRGAQLLIVSAIFTTTAAATVALRLFTRLVILRIGGGQDVIIFAALLLSIAFASMMIMQVHYGLGRHFLTLSPEERIDIAKFLYISLILYYPSVALVKFSILLQYIRIFVNKSMQIASWIILALVGIYTVITVFTSIFVCHPISNFWEKPIPGSTGCLDVNSLWFSNAWLNIFSDVAIFIAPMPVISSLHLPRGQKIGLMFIFALGGVTCVVSILRLQSLKSIERSDDPSWDNLGTAIWSIIELNTGIICACLPASKSFVAHFCPKLLGASTRKQVSEPTAADSRRTNKTPNTHSYHNSFQMQDMKPGIRSDTSGTEVQASSSRADHEDGNEYSHVAQGKKVVDLESGINERNFSERSESIYISQRNLILPRENV